MVQYIWSKLAKKFKETGTAVYHTGEFLYLLLNVPESFMTFSNRRFSTSPQRDDYGSAPHLGVFSSVDEF